MDRPACLPASLFELLGFATAVSWFRVPAGQTTVTHAHALPGGHACHVPLDKYVFDAGGELYFTFVGVCPHRIAFWTEPAPLAGCEPSDEPVLVNPQVGS